VDRSHCLPVPYHEANCPQAWAAATPILLVQLFLGLAPDAPNDRCSISPWLPPWLPELELAGIPVGKRVLSARVARRGSETVIERLEANGIDVQEGSPPAPLWGAPG
jgi:hypothetical protein